MIWILMISITLVCPAFADESDRGSAMQARESREAYEKFRYSLDVEKDEALANQWVREAAAKGHVEAMLTLGEWLDNGSFGNSENDRAALEYYSKAALKDSARGWYLRARIYEQGNGPPRDLRQARNSYRKTVQAARADRSGNSATVGEMAAAAIAKLDGASPPRSSETAAPGARAPGQSKPAPVEEPPAPTAVRDEPEPDPEPTPQPEKKQEFPNASRYARKLDYEGKNVIFLTIYEWEARTDTYKVRRRDKGPDGWAWAMQSMTGDELRDGWKLQRFEPAWCPKCRASGVEMRRGEDKESLGIVYHPGGPGSSLSAGNYGSRTIEETYVPYSCSECSGLGWKQPSFGTIDL